MRLASEIDHPLAKAILEKEVPVLLRAQRGDGGWGDQSLVVFRALRKHGLLDRLRGLPPQPPDWRIVKSIPAPAGELSALAWGDGRLWVYDRKANQAIAVSPDDGTVLKTVKLPVGHVFGLGWWDDALAVAQQEPKRVLQVDPESGAIGREVSLEKMHEVFGVAQVGGAPWIADGFMWSAFIVHPASPGKERWQVLGCPTGGWGTHMAAAGDGVWHFDCSLPILARSGLDGQLLDWGERPFDGLCDGLAWDGQRLWAHDPTQKRLCVIEKAQDASEGEAPAAQGVVLAVPKGEKGNVERDGGRVWIEGVPTLGWGRDKECTFAGALEAALAATKQPRKYSDLMGLSSLAFRVRWYQGKGGRDWCPSCAVGEQPGEEVDAVGQGIGWQFHCEGRLGQAEPHMEQFTPEIAASINAGLPVLAYEPRLNLDVVYGYEDGGKLLLLRDYFQGETPLRLPAEALRDAALRATAADALQAARTAEAAGLKALADTTPALGAK